MEAGKPFQASLVIPVRVDNSLDQGAGGKTDGLLMGWTQGRKARRTIHTTPLPPL